MNKKIVDAVAQVTRRDGWFNLITGLGVRGTDKRVSADIAWSRMDRETADALYAADDLLARVVDQLPNDALREGFEWEDEAVDQKLKAFKLTEKIDDVWKKARQYGGAALLFVPKNRQTSKPRQPGEDVSSIVVLSRWELAAGSEVDMDLQSANFGMPLTYRIVVSQGTAAGAFDEIHYSHLQRWDGTKLPRLLFQRNNYWHDSIMTRILNAVRNYQTAHDAAATIVHDFNVGVWKMKNLADLIGGGREADVIKRVEIANMAKSITRSMILDDMDSYEDQTRNVTGLPEVLDKIGERLVAATSMPHTLLLGQSPQASNGTGNSTTMSWYDYVASQQTTYLKPKLQEIANLILGVEGAELEFKSLWQMSETEQADTHQKQALADQIYLQFGVVAAHDVAASRFGGKYSLDTTLSSEDNVSPQPLTGEDPATTGADVQKSALNGAQVTSLVELVSQVATGNIPRDSAVNIIMLAFKVGEDEANKALGSAGQGFKPTNPDPIKVSASPPTTTNAFQGGENAKP